MKYFLHDTNSFDDEKITELYLKFGYEGLGLFYTTLEKLGKQEKPVKTNVLKAQLKVGKKLNKCWLFMEQIGLLSSNNGDTFNKQLLNFSEKYQIKKEKTKLKVAEWRKNQEDKENVTSYTQECNDPKVKESKVKESKVNNKKEFVSIEFKDCFDLWLKYKSERKESYKSESSLIICYKNLLKMSNNNSGAALKIIEQSIANNWAGLFPLKIDKTPFGIKEKNRTYTEPQKF
jgi:hypothetical protein